jgi:hypothetical protein
VADCYEQNGLLIRFPECKNTAVYLSDNFITCTAVKEYCSDTHCAHQKDNKKSAQSTEMKKWTAMLIRKTNSNYFVAP